MKYLVSGILLFLISCSPGDKLFFSIDPSDIGIDFTNTLTESDDFNILDYLYFYNGGGVSIGDINNDGLPDIYLSGNQVQNKLFLNQGDLKFEDITEKAGVGGNSDWNTGAVMGDVNGDGLLDIYVCAVVGIRGLGGYNELFINNGDNTFTERAQEFGLDFDTYSSSAAFLDYDSDGDLDIYLLHHAIHTQESFGHADLRQRRSYETGDKLLRNDGKKFTDVSEEAGIFGGVNGYGLGIAIADFNQDSHPDIYVGNDFHEDDYYYLNNGDGTFTESLKQYFGHTTRFSMGNDVADINHDGLPDIISLDMLPEDETVLKSSQGDEDVNIQRLRIQRFGYHYQFSRNMLQVNSPNGKFTETALLSGIAATDWSWGALFADYDLDGNQDLFIVNGIPRRPNDLDYLKFVSDEQVRNKINTTKLVDQQALELMPSGEVPNYFFQGSDELVFEDKSGEWVSEKPSISTAAAFGDLDNDGDLDLVINNVNSAPSLYVNQSKDNSYLKLRFDGPATNTHGIGTKVYSYHGGRLQFKELYTVRGFQSSSEPVIHFGYGKTEQVDSLLIVWPNGSTQTLKNVPLNQTLIITAGESQTIDDQGVVSKENGLFQLVEGNLGIDFIHKEDRYIDFDRQSLMPYQVSDRGPATALGDLDGDGQTDVFFGGSKFSPAQIYLQKDGGFTNSIIPVIADDSVKEDVAAAIADFNNDQRNDIVVGTGGADFFNQMKPLLDSYYIQSDSGFVNNSLPDYYENASVIRPYDIDQDGDLDLFVGSQSVSADFGATPTSYLLRNDAGSFSIIENENLQNVGMVTDAIWDDYDNDGQTDLIIVGEWMAPKFFKNDSGVFNEQSLPVSTLKGLWQSVTAFDIDSDGDMDYVLGNWGLNSKFTASEEYPLKMYYGDLDNNGSTETIVATAKNGKYYPLEGLDGLAGQMIQLKKKFTAYQHFAGKTIDDIFEAPELEPMTIHEVTTLASGYLKNENGAFSFYPFPLQLQVSPIMAFTSFDFDGDDRPELLAAGNYFGVKPFQGRLDGFPGAIIDGENDIISGSEIGLDLTLHSVRHLNVMTVDGSDYLLVTINNGRAQLYKIGE